MTTDLAPTHPFGSADDAATGARLAEDDPTRVDGAPGTATAVLPPIGADPTAVDLGKEPGDLGDGPPPPPIDPPGPPSGGGTPGGDGDGRGAGSGIGSGSMARRFRRSTDDAYLGGVAGGLARYAGIDPLIARILLVVAATASFGLVAVAYLATWLLVPDDTQAEGPGLRWYREQDRSAGALVVLGLGLLVAAAAIDGAWEGLWGGDGDGVGFVAFVALIGLAFAYHGTRRDQRRGRRGHGPDGSGSGSGSGSGAANGPSPWADAPPPAPEETDAEVEARRSQRRRHRLARNATLLAALGTGGTASALWATGAWDVSGWVVPALVLGVLLVGLAAAPWVGWSWTLTGAAVVVLPFLVLASIPGVSLRGGIGERIYRPQQAAELQDRYQLGVGSLEVDLTDLPLADGSTTRVRVGVGVGEAVVRVPAEVDVQLEGHVSGGTVLVDGADIDLRGADVDFTRSLPAPAPSNGDQLDRPLLIIDITAGFAETNLIRHP